ncbi:hypothetical protein A2125_00010 [Candidatus Woesebacteria bacterium GWB1_43_5]|uniref:Bacterial toxin RNase RnlA/LsoA DBD domain-containing protein n=1 Tax=Candidatus Woesebacteria bacterium GWB1_43_5 TaxID=1802474 RepID=A0A1F7WSS9_9BACT|nr:MAG: hypothetical protein A2125_00010 [Candidatus Woesebacteria bacterium GWB1_43_5]
MLLVGDLKQKVWWEYLEADLQGLLVESQLLVQKVGLWEERFHDYSFVVFPASKAYEGFLKKLFLDLGFITKDDYYGKRFRIGKVLNPQLEAYLRKKESVYDRIVNFCGGTKLADKLWETWRVCRNLVFHWFPDEKRVITFEEARSRVENVIEAIDEAYKECRLK